MTLGIFKDRRNWRTTRLGETGDKRRQLAMVIKAFWIYNKLKQQYEELREDVIASVYSGGSSGGSGGSHTVGTINNPTLRGVELLEGITEITVDTGKPSEETIVCPDLWLKTVEKTMDLIEIEDEVAAEILRRRYFRNEGLGHTCYDLGISKSTYYYKHNWGIERGRDVAIQLGLIKIF